MVDNVTFYQGLS